MFVIKYFDRCEIEAQKEICLVADSRIINNFITKKLQKNLECTKIK